MTTKKVNNRGEVLTLVTTHLLHTSKTHLGNPCATWVSSHVYY